LTINELVARGLKESSARKGRKLAWELGFFDVVEAGTLYNAGKYRYSERWKLYPNGNYEPIGQNPPGINVYPQNGFQKKTKDDSSEVSGNDRFFSTEYLKVVK
jgi:hypothetical protein